MNSETQKTNIASILKKSVPWIITILIIGGIVFVIKAPNKKAAVAVGDSYPSLGQEHIDVGAKHIAYNSNPPTSGPHYAVPAKWGLYQNEIADETLVHNLEHGGIWISYKDLDKETISKIETLAKAHTYKIIVTPRAGNDAKIVLASWTRLVKLDKFDEDTILNFIKSNLNKSPEPNAD